jgi:hypothetical protein
MVSSISSSTLTVPTSTASVGASDAQKIKAADQALNALLNNPALLQALADHSAQYVPPSRSAILSILWSLMNNDGGSFISKSGIQRAVLAEGGGTIAVDALWGQLNPEKKSLLSAADFAVNSYLGQAVTANLSAIREAVDQRRVASLTANNSTSLLDFLVGGADNILQNFGGGTGTVLDLFS